MRLLRILRILTIVNKSPDLALIVIGFIQACRSVIYILLVLGIFLYMYSVLGTYLFQGNDPIRLVIHLDCFMT
jgi:hypothetical protein